MPKSHNGPNSWYRRSAKSEKSTQMHTSLRRRARNKLKCPQPSSVGAVSPRPLDVCPCEVRSGGRRPSAAAASRGAGRMLAGAARTPSRAARRYPCAPRAGAGLPVSTEQDAGLVQRFDLIISRILHLLIGAARASRIRSISNFLLMDFFHGTENSEVDR